MSSQRIIFVLAVLMFSLASSCSVHNSIRLVRVGDQKVVAGSTVNAEKKDVQKDIPITAVIEQRAMTDNESDDEAVREKIETEPASAIPEEHQEKAELFQQKKKDPRRMKKGSQLDLERILPKEEDAHWAILVVAVILGTIAGVVLALLAIAVMLLGVYDPSMPEKERIDGQKNFANVFKRTFSVSFSMFFIAGLIGLMALGFYLIYLQYGLVMLLLSIGFFILLLVLLTLLFNRISDGLMKFLFIGWGH